jgi:hypothetical protein
MSWTQRTGWRPVFHTADGATDDEIVHALDQGLRGRDTSPEFSRLGDDLPVTAEAFSDFAEAAAADASPDDRLWADFSAAFGCEITVRDRNRIQDTALRTMSGAGHQHFLLFFRRLVESTTLDHVRAALFAPWTYEDDGPSMRWDPVDDRRYAYRADDPAKSRQHPVRTVRGANRLAVESLLCFPAVPRRRQLETTGFVAGRGGGEFVWPIWITRVSLPVFRSLMSHHALAEPRTQAAALRAMGVAEVFRSRRLTEGRFRNFTPAEACLGFVP